MDLQGLLIRCVVGTRKNTTSLFIEFSESKMMEIAEGLVAALDEYWLLEGNLKEEDFSKIKALFYRLDYYGWAFRNMSSLDPHKRNISPRQWVYSTSRFEDDDKDKNYEPIRYKNMKANMKNAHPDWTPEQIEIEFNRIISKRKN